MDLALELKLGTVDELKRRMTMQEFAWWVVYASKKMLPTRRLEYYLARIALVTGGGVLDDYLIKVRREQDPQEAASVAAGFMANVSDARIKLIKRVNRRKR